jgi:HPt (histidine-containing phosphotransfer) domain-containing protein
MAEAMQNPQAIKALLARLWEQKKDVTLSRIAVVEQASSALASGLLTPELRAHAAGEAHKLAGSLGTFGFPEGSRLARAVEALLTADADLDRDDGARLAQLLLQLRTELQPATNKSSANETPGGPQK